MISMPKEEVGMDAEIARSFLADALPRHSLICQSLRCLVSMSFCALRVDIDHNDRVLNYDDAAPSAPSTGTAVPASTINSHGTVIVHLD